MKPNTVLTIVRSLLPPFSDLCPVPATPGGMASTWGALLVAGVLLFGMTGVVYALPGDVNEDGRVDGIDLLGFSHAHGSTPGDDAWNPLADLDNDGDVDDDDFEILRTYFGRVGLAPGCYVLDHYYDDVFKYSGVGVKLFQVEGYNNPARAAVDLSDGSCWVADTWAEEGRLVKLSSKGQELVHVVGFLAPVGIDIGQHDGSIWVADAEANVVIRLATDVPDGYDVLSSTGSHQTVQGFSNPRAISIDSLSEVAWIVDTTLKTVVRLDMDVPDGYDIILDTGSHVVAGNFEPAQNAPEEVAVDSSDGTCYVVDGTTNSIVKLSSSGLSRLWTVGGFSDPVDISVNPIDGSCWVACKDGDCVVKLSSSGAELARIGGFDGPVSVGVDMLDGVCWAVDEYGNNLTKLSPFGARLRVIGGFYTPAFVIASPGAPPVGTPAAVADVSPTEVDVLETVTLDGSGSSDDDGSIVRYDWDFDGDGTYDWSDPTTGSTTHEYDTPGIYNPVLRVTDNDHLEATDYSSVVRVGSLTAIAGASPTEGTAPLIVNFTGDFIDPVDGRILYYQWDFDTDATYDSLDETTGNIAYTYEEAGNYTATLKVTDSGGLTATDTVSIEVTESGPTVDASAVPSSGSYPLTVTFGGTATDPDGTVVLYQWDFDGDGTYDWFNASSAAATFTYSSANSYSATLRVTDNDGLTGTDTVAVVVDQEPPTAVADVTPVEGNVELPVHYDGSGSLDGDAPIVDYSWQFGDGGTSQSATGDYTYITQGSYNAVLTVTDGNGATDTASVHVDVYPAGTPKAEALSDYTPPAVAPVTINFSSTGSTDPDGSIVLYEWDFEGDGTYDWSDAASGSTSHEYDTPGTYNPVLRVTDNAALTDTDALAITVLGRPTVEIIAPLAGSEHYKSNVGFEAAAVDADGTIVSYEWDFDGDDTYDVLVTSSETVYSYATTGTYTAKVRVTDSDGYTATADVTFDIVEVGPSGLTVSTDPASPEGEVPMMVSFDGSASDADGEIVKYEWDFDGDGTYDWSNGGTAGTVWSWTSTSYHLPEGAIDGDTADRVVLVCTGSYYVKDFEVLVSTTAYNAGFTSAGTFQKSDAVSREEFTFASTMAKYVMLRITSGYSSSYVQVAELEAYAGAENVLTPVNGRTAYTYSSAGDHDATMRATDDDGSTATAAVLVRAFNAGDPVAYALVDPILGYVDREFFFRGTATDDGTITEFEWDFDNDGSYDWSDTSSGTIESFTSEYNSTTWAAANLIDGATGSGHTWSSSYSPSWPQEVVFSFEAGATHIISWVVFNVNTGASANDGAKDVGVWVSTTAPDSGYSLVGSYRLTRTTAEQVFSFTPATAQYVKIVMNSNYGGGYVKLSEFEVYSDSAPDNLLCICGRTWHSYATTGDHVASLRVTDNDANQDEDEITLTTVPASESIAMTWVGEYSAVVGLDSNGNEITKALGVRNVRAIEVDTANGYVWVADTDYHQLLRLDTNVPHGYDFAQNRDLHRTYRGFNHPWSLSLGDDGTIWVADKDNNRVVHLANTFPDGCHVNVTGKTSDSGPSGLDAYLMGQCDSVAGQLGQGIQLGGGQFDYVILPDTLFDGLGDFTFECWFQHSYAHQGTVLSCASKSVDNEFLIFLDTTGTSIQIRVKNLLKTFYTSSSINDSSPHHIAVTRSGADVTLLVDGSAVGTETITDNELDIWPGGCLLGQEQDNLGGGFAESQELDGMIDDVRIWNAARSATEIANNRNSELTGSESGLIGYWKLNSKTTSGLGVERYTGFNKPRGVSIHNSGATCWIADTENDRVVKLSTTAPDGYDVSADTGSHEIVEGFYDPFAVSVDVTDGSCWVGDYNGQQVVKLDAACPDGYDIGVDTGSHIAVTAVSRVYDVTVDQHTQNCLALDLDRDELVRISSDGDILCKTEAFADPYDVGVDPADGVAWVAEFTLRSVMKLSPGGDLLQDISRSEQPRSVAIDPQLAGLDPPQVTASATPTSGDIPVDVTFAGSATDNGTIALYEWDFDGDGTYDWSSPSTGNTSHVYDTPGSYVPVLRVTDDEGLSGHGFPGNIGVGPLTVVATATPAVVYYNENVTLDVEVLGPAMNVTLYEWDYEGDGTYDYSSTTTGRRNLQYASGVYNAKARVTTTHASATDEVTVTVLGAHPTADARANVTEGPAPLRVQFDGSFSNDSDGSIVLFQWDFDGDGTYDWGSQTGSVAGYSYIDEGVYFATLRVVDNDGLEGTDSVRINATQQPPVASFTASVTEGNAPLSVDFDASGSSDPDGTISDYAWNFGDGGSDSGVTVTHVFSSAGTRNVMLTVTDDKGATAQASKGILVKPTGSPTATAGADPTSGEAPLSVSLTGSGVDPDGTIALYEWDFDGDGTYDWSSASTGDTTHTYVTKGRQEAVLRVTDDAALTDTDRILIQVGSPPTALPMAVPTSGTAPLTVIFRSNGTDSDGTIELFEWDFEGDGVYDTDLNIGQRPQNFVHTYLSNDAYAARLRVTDNDGLTATGDITITVNAPDAPEAHARAVPNAGPAPLQVALMGYGTDIGGTLTLYEWDRDGDGTYEWSSTTAGETTYTYASALLPGPEPYWASFQVTDNDTNTATASVPIAVWEAGAPSVTASKSTDSGPVALHVEFSGVASDADGIVVLYEWDFDGNGSYDWSSPDTPNAAHDYMEPGTYFAMLRATDNDGLSGVAIAQVDATLGITTTQSDDAFDPTIGETITIGSVLTGPVTVTLRIVDGTGATVKTVVDAEERDAGAYSDAWDGKNTAEEVVPTGVYYYIIDYEYGGQTYSYDLTTTARTGIDPLFPDFSYPETFSPYDDEPMTMEFDLPVKSEVTSYIAWNNESDTPQYRIRTLYVRKPMASGNTVIVWDGTTDEGYAAAPGRYNLCVMGWDLAENAIIVEGNPVVSDVAVEPNYYSPAFNPYAADSTPELTISFTLSKVSNVTLTVHNDNNEVVRTMTLEDVEAGTSSGSWDGRDEDGYLVAEGHYRVGVQATASAGTSSDLLYALFLVYY